MALSYVEMRHQRHVTPPETGHILLPSRVSRVRIPSPAPSSNDLIPALASNSHLYATISLRWFGSDIDSNRMLLLCRAEVNHARYEHTISNTPSANKRSERDFTPMNPGVCGIGWVSQDIRGFLLSQDVIFVGGGNTANMLLVWRGHGMDLALR